MFYSVELLSIRRHAKFAKCWLAANLSAKRFNDKFRKPTVFAINIPETCGELIVYISTHDSDRRFSLYLSSQLMFGATRILYYQTDMYLRVQLELWITASSRSRIADAENGVEKKKRKKLRVSPVDPTLLPPEKPPVRTLNTNMVDESKITMLESNEAVRGYHTMMRDPGNFGALTTEEMEQLLEPDGLRLSESRIAQGKASPRVDESTPFVFQSPSVTQRLPEREYTGQIPDGTTTEIPLPTLTEEPTPIEIPQLDKEVPRTPIKRKLPSPPASETPSKKKLGLDSQRDAAEPISEPIDQPPAEIANEITSNQLSLDILEGDEYEPRTTRKKRRKLKIDKITKLPGFPLPGEDVKVYTTSGDGIKIPRSSANTLLTTPSSWQAWGNTLLGHYQAIIVELREQMAFIQKTKPRLREGALSPEPVRLAELPAHEPPVDMSGDIKGTTTTSGDASKVDDSKTLVSISIDDKPLQVGLPSVSGIGGEVPGALDVIGEMPELPEDKTQDPPIDVSNLPKTALPFIRDWAENEEILSTRSPSARKSSEKSVTHVTSSSKGSQDTSTSRSVGTNWVKADILGALEVLWQLKRIVYFQDICPPSSSHTRKDAGQVFVLLLELQKSKEVKLTQAIPYRDIYIQKYSAFF